MKHQARAFVSNTVGPHWDTVHSVPRQQLADEHVDPVTDDCNGNIVFAEQREQLASIRIERDSAQKFAQCGLRDLE